MQLIDALAQLNVENDEHWTDDGLPRLDVVQAMVGEEVSREDVTQAAPNFTRVSGDLTPPAPAPEPQIAQNEPPAAPDVAVTEPEQEEIEEEDPYLIEDAFGEGDERGVEIQAQLDDVRAAIAETQEHLDAGKRHLHGLQQQEAQLYHLLQAHGGVETTQDHISRYLAQQKKNLLAKAERVNKFREQGLTPELVREAMDVRAPVDRALNNPNRRTR